MFEILQNVRVVLGVFDLVGNCVRKIVLNQTFGAVVVQRLVLAERTKLQAPAVETVQLLNSLERIVDSFKNDLRWKPARVSHQLLDIDGGSLDVEQELSQKHFISLRGRAVVQHRNKC